ncbi:MAG TPA: hypothetical protein VK874_13670, partial [Gaiellaceae bacterium]|nr:hypothetical protein [Gaiellaceae bacterium]
MSRRALWYLVALAGLACLALPASGFAERPTRGAFGTANDTIHVDPVVTEGTLPLSTKAPAGVTERSFSGRLRTFSHGDPQVGESYVWLGLDDFLGQYVLKFFTLRAIGEHGEVWVADNINFPAGDCRNGVRTTITDEQVQYLLDEFDENMYPKESAAFSVPPERDGSNEIIRSLLPPNLAAL